MTTNKRARRFKSGRQIADGIYRDLERAYPIKITDPKYGEFDELSDGLPLRIYTPLRRTIEFVENTIATLPHPTKPLREEPEHPDATAKGGVRRSPKSQPKL